jgi:hypothetical protein
MRLVGCFGFVLAVLSIGCGSGISASDAQARCDQERAAKVATMTDKSYQQCLDCYQSCGDQCAAKATSPETYACP